MKKIIFIISLVAFLVWPLNYFINNKTFSLAPRHIFESDYQARQLILRNINIYPNIPLARLFQNKLVIISNKYFDNLFNLLDPNYYFFASHPREGINGQNYTRLPLLCIIPILFYLFFVKGKYKKWVSVSTLTMFLILSLFTNYFIYDFVLWPVFFLFIYFGILGIFARSRSFGSLILVFLLLESFYELSKFLK